MRDIAAMILGRPDVVMANVGIARPQRPTDLDVAGCNTVVGGDLRWGASCCDSKMIGHKEFGTIIGVTPDRCVSPVRDFGTLSPLQMEYVA